MKRVLSFTALLSIVVLSMTGCGKLDTPPGYANIHMLGISFEDSDGNDLVAPLGEDHWMPANERSTEWYGTINPERYGLSIVKSDNTVWTARTMEERNALKGPYFTLGDEQSLLENYGASYSGYWLWNVYRKFDLTKVAELDKELTYRIVCPEVFGNNAEHDIVTYWDFKGESGHENFPECTKALFEGKELPVKKLCIRISGDREQYLYYIKIVLDR